MRLTHSIKRVAITVLGLVALSMTAVAQEIRSEVSVQGTGFFTKDSDGNGIRKQADNTGGLLVGYRYNLTRWLAAEANYGFDRNTQSFIGGSSGHVESNISHIHWFGRRKASNDCQITTLRAGRRWSVGF